MVQLKLSRVVFNFSWEKGKERKKNNNEPKISGSLAFSQFGYVGFLPWKHLFNPLLLQYMLE